MYKTGMYVRTGQLTLGRLVKTGQTQEILSNGVCQCWKCGVVLWVRGDPDEGWALASSKPGPKCVDYQICSFLKNYPSSPLNFQIISLFF